MTDQTEHAALSPSAAHRWIPCPPSLKANEGYADEGNDYAREGSTAHEIAAEALQLGTTAVDAANTVELSAGELKHIDDAMIDHVQGYVDFVRGEIGEGALVVEERVNFGSSLDTPSENSFGTVDAYIVDLANKNIKVIDFKYGYVPVAAEHNPQAQLYALGVLELVALFEEVPDDTSVELMIHQPRDMGAPIKRAEVSIYQLRQFAQIAGKAGAQALAGEGRFNPGPVQCKYCLHKTNCEAFMKYSTSELMDFLGDDQSDHAQQIADAAATLPNTKLDELGSWMAAVPKLEDFCKSIRAEVERRLLDGQHVPGFKLVEGKMGNRKWVDEKEALETLKSMRMKEEDIYKRSLNNPTQITKKLEGSVRKLNRIAPLITRSPGKPSVAPEDDPREALASAQDMIENLNEKDEKQNG